MVLLRYYYLIRFLGLMYETDEKNSLLAIKPYLRGRYYPSSGQQNYSKMRN